MHYRYVGRLRDTLRDFCARLSDINSIYRATLAEEYLQVQPKWWKRIFAKFWRQRTADSTRVMHFMTALDENRVIDITSLALGGKLAAHRKFKESHSLEHLNLSDIQKDSLERPQRTTIATRPNALRGTSLQEVVVEVDARDVNLHKVSKTSVEFSRNGTSNSKPASSILQNETDVIDTSRVHKMSRHEIGIQGSGSYAPYDGGDLKLAKRREERAAARATQRSLQSAGAAAGSSREAADPHFRKSQTEVDI